MAIKVGVIVSDKRRARKYWGQYLAAGIEAVGDRVESIRASNYQGIFSDAIVFYGFDGSRESKIAKAFEEYRAAGLKAVYVDLGYFNDRRKFGRYDGYHRFSVNARHPTAYFQNVKHPSDRFEAHGRRIMPMNLKGTNILLCGMSDKAAKFDGCVGLEQWERVAISKIRAATDRPIVYRPKPRADEQYPPIKIKGVGYSDPSRKQIADELKNAWAVVSHHSNAGIDGLLAGIPCFQDEGVALALGLSDLSKIEQRRIPTDDERRQFAADVAYCQFNRIETENGLAWRHLKNEGLVP